MTGTSILTRFHPVSNLSWPFWQPKLYQNRPDLHSLYQQRATLPRLVLDAPLAMRCLDLLGPLAWHKLPERNLRRNWGQPTVSYASFAAACLLKLHLAQVSMAHLRQFLVDHPPLVWLLGFPLVPDRRLPYGFDPDASLPTHRHFTRLLRSIPNAVLQFLLADTARLILHELTAQGLPWPDCISLDTKHIIAWVKENNPKAYLSSRFNKDQQPRGDPDCKLGCKRRHNQSTPTKNGIPAKRLAVGEFYWGYGSGVVAAKVPEFGEFVIAELTQTFDQADVSYFFPLMAQVEERMGQKPRCGAFDAAFDAWYVYDYFHQEADPSAFAAVPFSEKGGYKVHQRRFSADGLPLCAADLPMPLQFTYTDRTLAIIEHERGKYVCPLRFPERTAEACPANHKRWTKDGCTAAMPTSIGARLRYQLDRESPAYKQAYSQRTATERINSQAVNLGIERPHLRNGAAIANINTLIYTLINLRLLQRIRRRRPRPE